MKQDKILDRIRKLLLLAEDSSSPNEAAIAAQRARALMDKYQVTEMDISTLTTDGFSEDFLGNPTKRMPKYLNFLVVQVAKLNDCKAVYRQTLSGKDILFQGLKGDTICCIEMMKYLMNEMNRQAKNIKGRKEKNQFKKGFSIAVMNKIKEILTERDKIKTSNGKGLVVLKMALVNKHFGKPNYKKSAFTYTDSYAYEQGYNAGSKTSLNRQVNENNQKRIQSY